MHRRHLFHSVFVALAALLPCSEALAIDENSDPSLCVKGPTRRRQG